MILGYLKARVSRHFVLEGIFVLAIVTEENVLINVEHAVLDIFLAVS